jgi:hypothetical protein
MKERTCKADRHRIYCRILKVFIPTKNEILWTISGQYALARKKAQKIIYKNTRLRDLIPTHPENRKLSKIETLRLATSYIHHLAATLQGGHQHPLLLLNYAPAQPGGAKGAAPVCTFCLRFLRTQKNDDIYNFPHHLYLFCCLNF